MRRREKARRARGYEGHCWGLRGPSTHQPPKERRHTLRLHAAPAAVRTLALAQAALAVHGTRITGREAARQLLLSAHRGPARPASLLRRLQRADPQAQRWLAHHQSWSPEVGLP